MRHLKRILVAALLGIPAPLLAQRAAPELVIRVVDQATGAAVPSARVEISGKRRAGLTSEAGELRIAGLEARKHLVGIERVGYKYEQFIADMTPGGTLAVDIELAPEPVALAGVRATSRRERKALRDVGLYERARQGFATVIDRDRIERRATMQPIDLLRGVRGFRVGLSPRGDLRLFSSRGPVSLGTSNNSCEPALFLDGVSFPTRDLNTLNVADIEAIEAFPGMAGVPLRYSPIPHPCGSVFVWTRAGL